MEVFCILKRAYVYQNSNCMFKNRYILFVNCPSVKFIKFYRTIQKDKALLHITTWTNHTNIILSKTKVTYLQYDQK